MFDITGMMFNYESRKVARYPEDGEFLVDTCRITDSKQPYETAVQHSDYNDGAMVIVEMYDSITAARAGHEKWVALMTGDPLPKQLVDVSTSGIVELMKGLGDDREWTVKKRTSRQRRQK